MKCAVGDLVTLRPLEVRDVNSEYVALRVERSATAWVLHEDIVSVTPRKLQAGDEIWYPVDPKWRAKVLWVSETHFLYQPTTDCLGRPLSDHYPVVKSFKDNSYTRVLP